MLKNSNFTLSAPLHVDFEITGRCQLRCDYCSAMPLGGADVPTERALEIFSEIKGIGVYSILLSGGEPTVHRDFLHILKAAADSAPSIAVNTNGLRLEKMEYCLALQESAPNALFAISLDSADPALNDLHRGRGGRQAIQAIQNCVAIGMKVCISSVLTQSSLPSAIKIIERFWPAVKSYRFFPQVPRSEDDLAKVRPSYRAETSDFYRMLSGLVELHPEIHLLTPTSDVVTGISMQGQIECACGHSRIYVRNNFDVFPCFYSAVGRNKIGSLKDQSLHEVWHGERAHRLRVQSNLCGLDNYLIPIRYVSD